MSLLKLDYTKKQTKKKAKYLFVRNSRRFFDKIAFWRNLNTFIDYQDFKDSMYNSLTREQINHVWSSFTS